MPCNCSFHGVFDMREYWARGQREGRLLSSSPNVDLQLPNVIDTFDIVGATLAVSPIPCLDGCINSKASILFESEVFVNRFKCDLFCVLQHYPDLRY